jgi:hypothetical protein
MRGERREMYSGPNIYIRNLLQPCDFLMSPSSNSSGALPRTPVRPARSSTSTPPVAVPLTPAESNLILIQDTILRIAQTEGLLARLTFQPNGGITLEAEATSRSRSISVEAEKTKDPENGGIGDDNWEDSDFEADPPSEPSPGSVPRRSAHPLSPDDDATHPFWGGLPVSRTGRNGEALSSNTVGQRTSAASVIYKYVLVCSWRQAVLTSIKLEGTVLCRSCRPYGSSPADCACPRLLSRGIL